MKKHDFIIIAAAAVLTVLSFFAFSSRGGTVVTVKQNNQTVYKGSLFADTTVKLENNTLVIENGTVYMKNANCKNGVCVHTGKISKKGESIICLPNRVIAQIE